MFSNILPAPGTLINGAGILDSSGLPAPGFSGVGLKSKYNANVLKSRSNRGQISTEDQHSWSFTISYHPMTIDLFTSLESFLMGYNTRKNPFYVTLPNYAAPKNAAFEAHAIANVITVFSNAYAKENTITITAPTGLLPGCLINIVDSTDALHKSTYKVARVETPTAYVGTPPASGKLRLTLMPPLQRDTPVGAVVRFINPLIRVYQTNDIEEEYDSNNLVSFSLEVEEILP